jgi:hypothetical protein
VIVKAGEPRRGCGQGGTQSRFEYGGVDKPATPTPAARRLRGLAVCRKGHSGDVAVIEVKEAPTSLSSGDAARLSTASEPVERDNSFATSITSSSSKLNSSHASSHRLQVDRKFRNLRLIILERG